MGLCMMMQAIDDHDALPCSQGHPLVNASVDIFCARFLSAGYFDQSLDDSSKIGRFWECFSNHAQPQIGTPCGRHRHSHDTSHTSRARMAFHAAY